MKILHTADLHARRENAREFFTSCDIIVQEASRNDVQVIAIAGDLWHGPVQNSAGSLFPDFVEAVRRLADIAPVALIYGTPSHDVEGSLDIFETLECRHGIKVLAPGTAYVLRDGRIHELARGNEHGAQLLIFGIPEPSKKWILASSPSGQNPEFVAREAFRMLCNAIGCMRDQYPSLPSLVLAHGQAEGARTASGRILSTGDGLYFTRDHLKALKAEYIALGDIHQPQHIDGTRAWYAGSAYPLDFGETHKAGCWIVTLHEPGKPVDMERIDFPHPTNRHIISHAACAMEIPTMRGQKVWYEVQGTRQELAILDSDIILARLRAHGAAEGSRVTFDVKEKETIRVPEIVEKKGLVEKLRIWAEASGETLTDGIIEKARTLERETESRSLTTAKAHYRIDRLVLRGAIGLWAKSGKDEIELDLASLGKGVITLLGHNGAGKTTILENLHPWPRLLTREGPIRDHFRLADSFRDLYLTDEETSIKYRCLIRMRADIPSGSTEYWLFRDAGNGFIPLPGINGRLEPYQEWIDRLFGSLSLYQRTAFVSQKASRNCPDLGNATKGERKELFSELCGIEWLEQYRETAREQQSRLNSEIQDTEARHSLLTDVPARCAALTSEIAQYAAQAAEMGIRKEELSKNLENIKAKLAKVREQDKERERLVAEREQAHKNVVMLKAREQECMNRIESLRASLRLRKEMEAEIARANALIEKKECLLAEKTVHDEAQKKLMTDYIKAMTDYTNYRHSLINDLGRIKTEIATLESEMTNLENRLVSSNDDHCPLCGQMLPEEQREKRRKLCTEWKESLSALQKQREALTAQRKQIETQIKNQVLPSRPTQPEYPRTQEIKEIDQEIEHIDLKRAWDIVHRAEAAEATITQLRKELSRYEAQIGDECTKSDNCKAMLDAMPGKLNSQEITAEMEVLEQKLSDVRIEEARAQARREEAEKQLDQARHQQEEYESLGTRLRDLTHELCEWAMIERAVGRDGIQALELDALAPSISEIATRLLTASGNEGKISIQTLRIAGKGAKQHAIEDFRLLYINGRGEEQDIATLSGGEAVWIRKAIYDAFEIIRMRNTGIQFCTVILDEADGALDPESRLRYMRMIEAAHRESGRYQTLIVTHSTELQQIAHMSITVADLHPRKDQKETIALSA